LLLQTEGVKRIDDVDRGSWLRDRIMDEGGYPTVAGTGWEAYARILHPVEAFGDIDGAFVTLEWSWAEAARRRGLGMHPLVDWNTIGRQSGQVQIDGLTLSSAQEGILEPRLLRHLAAVLETATSTPDEVTIGVWTGFGDDDDFHAVAEMTFSDSDEETQTPHEPTSAEIDALMQRLVTEAHDRLQVGILPAQPQGPLLELPGREYYLATGTLRTLGDDAEHDPSFANGLHLIWPADHTWLVASEIDFDSTIVGGSKDLIYRITQHPELEAFEVRQNDRFDIDARTIR
jgi:hypothetical protein